MSALVARDTDTDTDTNISTRPSTATTTSTMTAATTPRPSTSNSTSTSTSDTRKSALVHQTPSYPPPPPPQQQHHHHQQETQQPQTVSSSVPRTLWSLRRSRSSARILALASTREYVHAKLCGGLPSPSAPGKNLFPAPQQQKKKPIDIHDPEWLARHGLKWDARGLGLVSAAV